MAGSRQQVDHLLGRHAALYHPFAVQEGQTHLAAAQSGGHQPVRVRQLDVLAQRVVVGGQDLDASIQQPLPKRLVVALRAQRWGHRVQVAVLALEDLVVVEQVVRTGFRAHADALALGIPDDIHPFSVDRCTTCSREPVSRAKMTSSAMETSSEKSGRLRPKYCMDFSSL